MSETWILGVRISDRMTEANRVQSILTTFGCSIKTRLGLHEVNEDYCSPGGLLILELSGQREEFFKLENELLRIDGLEVRKMVFE
jgi:hypothetical protein